MAGKSLIRRLVWCLVLLAHWHAAQALTAECVFPEHGTSLAPTLSTLEDPDGRLTLETARDRYASGGFRKHQGGTPSFGFVRGVLWARVQLPAVERDCSTLMVLEQPRINLLELFMVGADGTIETKVMGSGLAFSARAIDHRFPNVRIERQAGPPVDVFIRIQSAVSVQLPLSLHSEASLFRQSHGEQAGMGLYYGLLLALLLYSSAVLVGMREASYLYYVLYLAALCLFSLNFTGHGAQYLWPDATAWQVASLPLSFGALVCFAGLFVRNFLDLAGNAPWVGRLVLYSVILAVPVSLAGVFQLAPMQSTLILTGLVVRCSVLITIGAVLSARRGYRPATYFLLAWCLQLLGGIAVPLSAFGWIPRTQATEYGLQIGSAAEMMLLSFALVYRINLLRDKKNKAEREALHEAGRLHLEESLQRSLEERNTILDNAVVAIIFLNAEDRVQWANQATHKMFGVVTGHAVGESIETYYPSHDDYLRVGAEVSAAVAGGHIFDCEMEMRRRSGALLWVHLSGRAVNQHDLSRGTVWVVRDISRRKELEDALRRKTAEQEIILQSTQIGITLSVNRHHRWFNRTFADMMGFSEEELLGVSSRIHFPDKEAWERLGAAAYPVLSRGEPYATECQMRRKDGELIWIQLFGKVVDAGDMARGAIWTFVDVTQRHQAEEGIRLALAQQVELNDLKSKFVSMTSHEFRTPLATILSSSELFRYYGDRLPADEKIKVLGNIDTAVTRMTKMLDEILMIGRADSGNLEFRPVICRPWQLCLDLANETARAASHDGSGLQRLDVRFAGTEVEALLDESLLRHILGNLLGNAFKYSPAGGRVGLNVVSELTELVIEVSDQGIGIPSSDIPKLFETFHRAGNVGNISGTGLGLAIVKRAVELHGGKIEVDSRVGEGTRFTVRLPHMDA